MHPQLTLAFKHCLWWLSLRAVLEHSWSLFAKKNISNGQFRPAIVFSANPPVFDSGLNCFVCLKMPLVTNFQSDAPWSNQCRSVSINLTIHFVRHPSLGPQESADDFLNVGFSLCLFARTCCWLLHTAMLLHMWVWCAGTVVLWHLWRFVLETYERIWYIL